MAKRDASGAKLPCRMLSEWNDTARPYSRDARIEELIEKWAADQPRRVVAVSQAGELTFGELDRLANKLASQLRARGVGKSDFVLLCLERDHAFLVSVLAVLKTGAAFIPIEPEEPTSRIAPIAALDEVSFVIADPAFASLFDGMGLRALLLNLKALDEASISEDRVSAEGTATDPAYGIATSGSSGTPKTVAVAHRSVVNLIEWTAKTFQIGPEDRGLWVSPASFDLSMFDLLGLPALGASVRMTSRDQRRDPIACSEILCLEPITFWNSTPALLQTLIPFLTGVDSVPARNCLRVAFISGDWVPLKLPDQLRTAFPDVEFISLGGATEATVWSNYLSVGEIDPQWTSIPYGRPMQNARYYVLDPDLQPCDVDEKGELFIAGDCLAIGYLGDARLTAARFLPDPFMTEDGARMYRTGDGARFWSDGTIELLGRLDNQVNLCGYRVDLGEIETAMKRCGLSQAVAVALDSVAGTKRIVAAGISDVAGREGDGLREALRQWLPSHMIPDTVRLSNELPLTANGKADCKAIAAMFETEEPLAISAQSMPVRTPAPRLTPEEVITFLGDEIRSLRGDGTDGIAVDRPLGEAGLGSLDFAVLSGRIYETFGLRVSPVEFYASGTLSSVAESISVLSAASTHPNSAPATSSDETGRSETGTRVAIVGISCRVPGAANLDEFWEALRAGRTCIGELPQEPARSLDNDCGSIRAGFLEDIDSFDAKFFGITPREAEAMDPRQRILLEAVWTAIEHAGDNPIALAGSRTGVFVGATGDDFSRLAHRTTDAVAAHTLTGVAPSVLPNRVSFSLDLRGPSECVDTACSSSLVALHRAIAAITADECDAAVVGGVSLMLDRATHTSLERIGMLSEAGACKTFDASADGYVRGEGVAVVYLKRVEAARESGNHVHAVVLGSAVNHSGRSVSLTSPTPRGQRIVVHDAYRQAGIDPRTIGMIETHGTGTALGDPIETRALVEAFANLYRDHGHEQTDDKHCALSAVKTNIGHLEAAAGMAGLIKAVLAASHGFVPPTPHFTRMNEQIDLDGSPFFISPEGGPWPVAAAKCGDHRRAGVSSFGFGGTNAHVVVECPPNTQALKGTSGGPARAEVIVVSAREPAALHAYAQAYGDFFSQLIADGIGDDALERVGVTSRTGRPDFKHRFACVVDTLAGARDAFRSLAEGSDAHGVRIVAECPRELKEAARAWAAGDTVDWSAVAGLGDRASAPPMAIPTYPFMRVRHWPKWLTQDTKGDPAPSEKEGRRDIDFTAFAQATAQHRISGNAFIPGSVFIQIFLEVARDLTGQHSIRLERIRFLGNIERSRIPQTLSAGWKRQEGAYQITLCEAPDGPVLCRAVSRIASADGGTITLPARADTGVGGDSVYASLLANSVDLGPALRMIQRAWWTHEHCVATLSDEAATPASDPALMDAAFQAALLWQLETDRPSGLPIPISIDTLTFHRSPPTPCAVVVTAAGQQGKTGKPRITDLVVADPDGRVSVRMEGIAAMEPSVQSAPTNIFVRTLERASVLASPEPGPNDRDRYPALAIGFGEATDTLAHAGVAIAIPESSSGMLGGHDVDRLFGRFESVRGAAPSTIILGVGDGDWQSHLDTLCKIGQALVRRSNRSPARFLAMRLIDAEASDTRALGSAMGAFCRSLRLEDPRVLASSVGLRTASGARWTDTAIVETVRSLIGAAALPPEAEIECANGAVLTPHVRPGEAFTDAAEPVFREGGVYLVTGGLGGLGRHVAVGLAARYNARLMLCGRTPMDANVEARLTALRSSDGEIEYRMADVTNRPAVRKLVADTHARFGAINGVIHCAGVLRDGLLAYCDSDDLFDVVRPKASGARHLDLETRDDDLDFFALFSSLVAATGNAGQCGYAFANGWLDGFAQEREASRRAAQCRGRTVAIGWGPWQSDGMRMPPSVAERLRSRHGLVPFDGPTGVATLEWALAMHKPNLLAIAGNPNGIAQWLQQRATSPDLGLPHTERAKTL